MFRLEELQIMKPDFNKFEKKQKAWAHGNIMLILLESTGMLIATFTEANKGYLYTSITVQIMVIILGLVIFLK